MSAVQDGDEADGLASMTALLELLDAEPTLLAEAPPWARFQLEVATHRRLAHEEHPCLRCGAPASIAMLSQHRDDRRWRWLDLCEACGWLMRRVAEKHSH